MPRFLATFLVTLLPAGLARRFALGAAGVAAAAVLVASLASWWLINQQHRHSLQELAARETQFHAAAIGSDLSALAARMSEIAGSTILATGLVDSAGRETYLTPFLAGVRQINGVPVQLLFTDFEGKEIATNGVANFTPVELKWLREELVHGRRNAVILDSPAGSALVAMEPLTYARTSSPEGAVLYKVMLGDMRVDERVRLQWGAAQPPDNMAPSATVLVPQVFAGLNLRVIGPQAAPSDFSSLAPQYLTIFFIALLLFIAVLIAGMRLARFLTRDLRRLQAFSGKVMGSGLSTERAPVEGSAEVASLAVSINSMLDRLHEQHVALLREGEKLTDLAEALQVADRRKDEFLATLAHELRNPLAPIKNSVMVFKSKPLGDPQLAWARDVMSRQVDQMSRLLDDLLDVGRITRNKLELRKERVPLTRIIEAAVETSRPLFEAAHHQLTVSQPHEPLWLDADPLRLAQVFANLLNNAAKYTEPGGHITITASQEDGDVLISVKDNGIGIPAAQLPYVFEMFMQTDAPRSQGGLGIGLSLVRGLVEMHGGNVSASSSGQDMGTEFVVRLKLAEASEAALPQHEHVAPSAAIRQGGLRIIVVDDNHDAAESLAVMLALWGHEVHTAQDGPGGLALAEATQPQVAILDIGMPGMDGYEAARRLRAEPWGEHMILIALTGWGQSGDKMRAETAGFDHHLVKPADMDLLQAMLSSCTTELTARSAA